MYKLDNNVEWTEELKNAFKTGTTRAKIIYDGDKEINETNSLKNLTIKDTQYIPNLGFIGQACSKELSFSFVNTEGINLENKEVIVKIGAEYNGDVYYITYGNFIVSEAPQNDKTNNVTSVVANDYMIKFDVPYEDTITYPCTLKELVENICEKVGVELGSESFSNQDFIVVDNQFENNVAREVIKNAAKCAFSWARIGQDNKLYFDFEPSEEIEIVGSNFTITNANPMQQAEITEIRGKGKGNLISKDNWELGSISGSGSTMGQNTPATNRIRNIEHIAVEPNTTYTLTLSGDTSTVAFVFEYNSEKVGTKRIPSTWIATPFTFTTQDTTYFVRVIFSTTDVTLGQNVDLRKEGDKVVNGDNKIVIINKNIFDINNAIDRPSWNNKICDRTITDANNFTLKSNATDDWCGIYLDNLDTTKNYTIKFTAALLEGVEGNSLYVGTADANTPRIAIYTNIPKEVEYSFTNSSKIYIKIVSQTRVQFSNVQLEIGEATSYIPHQESSKNITLARIPSEYQEVEYIQSNGSQYINTGYNLWNTTNWKIQADFSIDEHYNYNAMFGYDDITDTSNEVWIYSNTRYAWRACGGFNGNVAEIPLNTKINIIHDNSGSRFITTLNDNVVWNYNKLPATSNHNLCFGHRAGGGWLKGKIYGLKLWSEGALVRDFIPCYRISNNIAGLYDTVNNVFYPNANTSSTAQPFISGEKIGTNIQLSENDKVWNNNGTWQLNDTVITDNYLLEQLQTLENIELYENLCYVDWIGNVKADMKLKYFSSEVEGETITLKDYKANNFKHADEYYGGLNRVGYADSDIEGQEEYIENAEDIEENGLKDLFIYDNLFAYTEAKRQQLVLAARKLLGFKYMPIQKIDMKGLVYLDCRDYLEITDADEDETLLYSRCFDHTIEYQGYVADTIQSLAPTETERTYENINSPLLANTRTQIIVDKANKKVNIAIADSEEAKEKATELEISVDEISGTVSDLVDVTLNGETSANNLIMNGINLSQPIKLTIKPITYNITTLYPRDTLYPSDDLFLTNKAIEFKRTYTELDIETGEEVEKTDYTYYEIPNSLLYKDSNTYDEFQLDYDTKTCKIIKKLDIDANGQMYELSTPRTEYYEYPYIELKDGDYVISVPGYETVYISATLMKKNEYTTKFATQVQVDTQVKQTENEVMISVNQKVSEDEFTKAEIIARINSEGQSEAKISADSVSLEGYTTINGGFSVDTQGNASIANGSVSINDAGIQLANGRSIVGGNGMLTQFQYSATGMLGHVQGANAANQRIALYIPIYIPQNFVITDAKLFLTHTYARVYEYTGSGYVEYACYARNIKLYKTTERGIAQISSGYFDAVAPNTPGTEIYNFGNASGKTFSSNSVEKITVSNIKDSLDEGMQYLYLADYVNNPGDWVTSSRMTGVVDASLYVTGYLQNNIE